MKRSIAIASGMLMLVTGCTGEQKVTTPSVTSRVAAPAAPATASPVLREVPSPAPAGAAEPFLSSARDGGVLLSWLEPIAATDRVALRFSRFADGRWSTPRTIVERNDLFVNWADFPSIVEDGRGTLFAHWLQKSGGSTYSYDVRMAISADSGATWGVPFLLNRDGKQSEHGFVTLAALPEGGIAATWLDGRKMSPAGGHESGGHEGAGEMTLRYATIDANGAMTDEAELDGRTCECCTTGMAMTAAGPAIAYRDRSHDDIRDISLVRRTATGWTEPRGVRSDGWKIDGCPVNGPQLDARGNHLAAAWFTAADDRPRVYAAFSTDGGATFANAIAVDDGKPVGRVDVVMLDDSSALITWLEQTTAGAEIRARRVSAASNAAVTATVAGASSAPVTRPAAIKIADATSARAAGFPRTTFAAGEVWFTWTEQAPAGKRIHVARARV